MTFDVTPLWKFVVGDLDGMRITNYSKIASERVVEVLLNAPLSLSGSVPSDNPQVYIPWTDDGLDDAYLEEGVRLIWGLRRELNLSAGVGDPPYHYVCRAATICLLCTDEALQDDARTRFVGWDPWKLLYYRPVVDIDGNLPGRNGLSWDDTKVSVIIGQLIRNTILNSDHCYIDAGDGTRLGEGTQYANWGGTQWYAGTMDATPVIDWNIPQGTSVGEALAELCAEGYCDIIMDPIYDKLNRPNYLVELNVRTQAGTEHPEKIFAWDMPGKSLVGITRQKDGSQRANVIKYYAGQGGVTGESTDSPPTSIGRRDLQAITKYGEYWAQQYFPGENTPASITAIDSLADMQLRLRAHGKITVTFNPAPERSPRPWQDYNLGDRVPVWASEDEFRELLTDQDVHSTVTETVYQRIYGWRTSISDEALESVEVLTAPEGFTG